MNEAVLKYIKTFSYMHNDNYQRFFSEAVDCDENGRSKDYEVMILGHSLGLTDKTMLNEIFNK
jgi:hypothetical protein